ncbi:glycogenin-1 isoform X1 [Lingula anatina]|uniref:Glycogenin-1 isoform X1 n=1 Tax=Lingula anatina TaxID=7574 RepID=A0A1S3I346_LINAN|nr:glycogenin-1 isoform X1 [Lingula anatina]|eukprot:XP_013392692.1 glycogenin-1 isoform X1 [Lingula anatina]
MGPQRCWLTRGSEACGLSGLAGELASLKLDASPQQPMEAVPEHERRERWERGQVDYLGEDSFQKIQERIDSTLQSGPPQGQPKPVDKSKGAVPKASRKHVRK